MVRRLRMDLSVFVSSCHLSNCLPHKVKASHWLFNCWKSSRKALYKVAARLDDREVLRSFQLHFIFNQYLFLKCKINVYQTIDFDLIRPVIEPEFTVSVADAVSTQPLIGYSTTDRLKAIWQRTNWWENSWNIDCCGNSFAFEFTGETNLQWIAWEKVS